jgi:two-component system chemotaxis response regulator CheB
MRPIRVLVVDDTVVVRRLVTDVLSGLPDIEVVGTAAHGRLALTQIPILDPDVVTLDVEMPVMDGLETLAELRRRWPRLPVIMFSTLTSSGAGATLDALALGANDYVTKPTANRDRAAAMDAVRAALVPLVRLWGRPRRPEDDVRPVPAIPRPGAPAPPAAPGGAAPPADGAAPTSRGPTDRRPPLGVVVGVSTGGPQALSRIIPRLPAGLTVPIVVVQHMPPVFTRFLAERLDAQSTVPVVEAEDGMPALPGRVHIAAGGSHLRLESVRGEVVLRHDDGPMENSCRPAVDVTLRSAQQVWGSRTLTVILTGMGSDGLAGARLLHAAGGRVLAQDAATSVVWGMPGAVVKSGIADAVLPLDEVAPALLAALENTGLTTGTGAR